MHWIDSFTICVIVIITLIPGYVLSSCCYSTSIQPLQPSSPYYKPDNNAPPSYAISLSASSQFAVNNPGGPSYLALITFPGNYVISAVPSGCVSVSINTVNCTISGMNQLVAEFASVIVADGTTPRLESVVVNGELCAVSSSCPRYTPTNPGASKTWPVVPVPSATGTPSSIRPSQSASGSSASLLPSSSSSTSTSTVNPTPGPGDNTPPSDSAGSQRSSVGLIVGLVLALALLLFLACLYVFRHHRRDAQNEVNSSRRWSGAAAAAALFRIKRKGSRLSLGRTSPQNSPNMASHSGPGPSSTSGNEVKVSSTSDDPFVQAGARPVSMSSTITGSEKSTATEAGVTGLGMTLIDIPEAHEPEDPPEVNYFQGENDEFERDPDAEFAEATTTATELILNKSGEQNAAAATPAGKNPWIARAASRSSRLHRAVSAASSRLLQSNDTSRRSSREQQQQQQQQQQPQQQQQTPHRQVSSAGRPPGPRFPRDGLFFKNNNKSDRLPSRSASHSSISLSRPPKSIHRSLSRSDNPSGQVIGTIRPEHHQQLMYQHNLDQGLTPEQPLPSYAYRQLAAGATSAGTAANAAKLSEAVSQGGLGFGLGGVKGALNRSRSDSAGSAVTVVNLGPSAFTNPGPPPQPPTRGMSRSQKATSSSVSRDGGASGSGTRRGYNQPIHIRPPVPTFQPNQQQQQPQQRRQQSTVGSEIGGSGLYGYM